MELISVIVPIYNVQSYLKQCVESLINQTYKNIEIILVNDGSTDKSGEIAKQLKNIDDRIKLIDKKNEGLGYARNSGLNIAKGNYVIFIDSDDYVAREMIEDLYDELKKNNSDTCLGGFKQVDDSGKILFIEEYRSQVITGRDIYFNLLPKMLGSAPEKSDSIRMSVWNGIYSMDIIKKNNIKFPSEREYISEDIIFDMEYYKYCNSVTITNTSYYYYRLNYSSLTKRYKSNRFELSKILYKYIESELLKNNMGDDVIYRAKRQFFINVRLCIKQENIKISNKKFNKAIEDINYICEDKLLKKIIENYPVNILKLKPKIFIYLVKYKMSYLLYLLAYFKVF